MKAKKIEPIGILFGVPLTIIGVLTLPYGFLCLYVGMVAWLIAFNNWLPE